ncbi:MAG: M14 family metallopeptidase [Phycisphaerales bacterium]
MASSKNIGVIAQITLCAAFIVPSMSSFGMYQTDMSGYHTNHSLRNSINSLRASSASVEVDTLGKSIEGNPIHVITLANPSNTSQTTPALLITAGLDGRYLVSTEVAIRLAERIVSDHPDLLESMSIYIIPRANPDGSQISLDTNTGHHTNVRLTDDDRDRNANEDPHEDLDGDGYITMMRRLNLPVQESPTHLQDPDDPRLSIEPSSDEDQRATFTLYSEGTDNDGDGKFNEDGSGGVDLDQNFMHRWPEHAPNAGRYPLSEPESRAIADFVFAHPNIVMALTLGRHDNLITQPDSKAKDITGTAPKAIDANDADLYKRIGKLFDEATGYKELPKHDIAGSFHAWLYAQRGIPSFAAVPWTMTDAAGAENDSDESATPVVDEQEGNGLTPSGIGDISQETIDELIAAFEAQSGEQVDQSMIANVTEEMIETFATQAGIEIQRVVEASAAEVEVSESDPSSKAKKSKKKSIDAKWLEYFENNDIDGFTDWTPYQHPTLGEVHIGGFHPLSKINPPASQLDNLTDVFAEFVSKLIDARPQVNIIGPEITELSDGLYEVRIAMANDGMMPTSTAFSQARRTVKPVVIRISSPVDHIVTGQRVHKVWGISAHGQRTEHRWIIRTKDLSSEKIEIIDPRFGNHTLRLEDQS